MTSQENELITFLFKEACRTYNSGLPERNEDTWYAEGQKYAYRVVLDILQGDEGTIEDVKSRM